jgi:hypothetical protein
MGVNCFRLALAWQSPAVVARPNAPSASSETTALRPQGESLITSAADARFGRPASASAEGRQTLAYVAPSRRDGVCARVSSRTRDAVPRLRDLRAADAGAERHWLLDGHGRLRSGSNGGVAPHRADLIVI